MQNNEALARKSGDDKKLQMVAQRKKKMEDRMGQEKNDKGHRFKVNKWVPFNWPEAPSLCLSHAPSIGVKMDLGCASRHVYVCQMGQ